MEIIPLPTGRVEVHPSQEIYAWIQDAILQDENKLQDGDVLVISSKIVSYFEDRVLELSWVKPSDEAKRIAKNLDTSDQMIEMVLNEADEILAETPWVLLTRKNGIFCANAGIDTSNVPEGFIVLWPEDSFASAKKIRSEMKKIFQIEKLAVLVIDSVCQPGRNGTTAVTLGYSGIKGFQDLKGDTDLYGNTLRYAALNIVDSLAVSGNLLMGESDDSIPMVIVRNFQWNETEETKNDEMIISPSDEMFPL